jgi:hypothetical protein
VLRIGRLVCLPWSYERDKLDRVETIGVLVQANKYLVSSLASFVRGHTNGASETDVPSAVGDHYFAVDLKVFLNHN